MRTSDADAGVQPKGGQDQNRSDRGWGSVANAYSVTSTLADVIARSAHLIFTLGSYGARWMLIVTENCPMCNLALGKIFRGALE